MSVPQGRNGFVSIGGTSYPVLNWMMPPNRNLVAPLPVGNTWQTHFGEGLRSTRFLASFNCREGSGEILALAFWNRFMSRTWSGGFDDTATSTIIAGNSKSQYSLANCKAESFSLAIAKGSIVGLQAVFVAPGIPTPSAHTPSSYAATSSASSPLMFDRCTFTGITGNLYGFELTFANNHLPDGRLDGTKTLAAWNAGVATCTARFTVDTRASDAQPFSDGATIALAMTDGVSTRSFSMTAVVPNNPDDGSVPSVGQLYQRLDCLVLGGVSTPPLVIS